MGEHISFASGVNLMIVLDSPIYITHTVTNWQIYRFNIKI
jgi:hypothetical protein